MFLMQAFVDAEFRGADLKSLNFVQKYIEAISLADIASIDGHRISHKAFEVLASNSLRNNTDWPKAVPVLPAAFIALWKRLLPRLLSTSTLAFPKG